MLTVSAILGLGKVLLIVGALFFVYTKIKGIGTAEQQLKDYKASNEKQEKIDEVKSANENEVKDSLDKGEF